MRLGCGCLALVLGAINVIIPILLIISNAIAEEPIAIGYLVFVILIFWANATVCLWAGWPAVRGGGLRLPTSITGEEEE